MALVPAAHFRYGYSMRRIDKSQAAALAKAVAVLCVRNSYLEDLHSGITPSSATGDYSDVKVVTPHGEIPWEKLSRISDEEMKRLMKEIVNRVFMFLCRQNDPEYLDTFLRRGGLYVKNWDEPELTGDFIVPPQFTRKRKGAGKRRKSEP